MTDAHEDWSERAAKREYLAGVSRQQAEYLAAKDIRDVYGAVPDSVRVEMDATWEAERPRQGRLMD